MPSSGVKKSSPALVAVAWLIVVVPAAWGLTFTVQNALKIFAPQAVAPAKTAPQAPTPAAPAKPAP